MFKRVKGLRVFIVLLQYQSDAVFHICIKLRSDLYKKSNQFNVHMCTSVNKASYADNGLLD